jgi:DNA-binding NarL/FixJ family response regulator
VQNRLEGITDSEYESLIDVALGLTDKAIAARRGLSTRGAQARIRHLYEKLGVAALEEPTDNNLPIFNSRTRAIYLALARGLINVDALRREQQSLETWLDRIDEPESKQ